MQQAEGDKKLATFKIMKEARYGIETLKKAKDFEVEGHKELIGKKEMETGGEDIFRLLVNN